MLIVHPAHVNNPYIFVMNIIVYNQWERKVVSIVVCLGLAVNYSWAMWAKAHKLWQIWLLDWLHDVSLSSFLNQVPFEHPTLESVMSRPDFTIILIGQRALENQPGTKMKIIKDVCGTFSHSHCLLVQTRHLNVKTPNVVTNIRH